MGNVRCHAEAKGVGNFVHYLIESIQRALTMFPHANIFIFGDSNLLQSESLSDALDHRMAPSESEVKKLNLISDQFNMDGGRDVGPLDNPFYFIIRSTFYNCEYFILV